MNIADSVANYGLITSLINKSDAKHFTADLLNLLYEQYPLGRLTKIYGALLLPSIVARKLSQDMDASSIASMLNGIAFAPMMKMAMEKTLKFMHQNTHDGKGQALYDELKQFGIKLYKCNHTGSIRCNPLKRFKIDLHANKHFLWIPETTALGHTLQLYFTAT